MVSLGGAFELFAQFALLDESEFIAYYIHVSIEGSSANEDKYIGEIKNNMLKTIAAHPLSHPLSLPLSLSLCLWPDQTVPYLLFLPLLGRKEQ
jgi:hypothetical protein